MPADLPTLQSTPDGRVLVPSAQKRGDGAPRFTMSLPPNYADDLGLALLARLESEHLGFEFSTRAFFDRHLAPGDIFLDIGAHFGVYSLAAASLYPGEIKVAAFEPHPLNALEMLRQMAQNGLQNDIDLVCCAAGARPGVGKLWPFSTMGNFLSVDRPEEAFADNPPLNVAILPLDMYVRDRSDFATGRIMAKVDVEGFEPDVMAGMDGLLAEGRIKALVFEKSEAYADPDRWRAFEAMVARLEGHGYRIYWTPHLNMACALIPWVAGNETGNLVALAADFEFDNICDGPYVPYTGLPPVMREDFSTADQVDLTERLIRARASDGWRWANPRHMGDAADDRAALAAAHVPPKSRVLDLGAGAMGMALRLRGLSGYTPVDLVRYAAATVLADLNEGDFPDGDWDCALALALFEHIHDVAALLTKIRAASRRLICIYECLEEVGDIAERRALGYFNDFDRDGLQKLFAAAGWRVTVAETHGRLSLFVCD